jgi:hypothetical protein
VLDIKAEFLTNELLAVLDATLVNCLAFFFLDIFREMLREDGAPPLVRNVGIVQGLL